MSQDGYARKVHYISGTDLLIAIKKFSKMSRYLVFFAVLLVIVACALAEENDHIEER